MVTALFAKPSAQPQDWTYVLNAQEHEPELVQLPARGQ